MDINFSNILPKTNMNRVFSVNDTSSITKDTRKESYERVVEELGKKQRLVYESLYLFDKGVTAKELAVYMHSVGLVASPERNSVHPRLNELIRMGSVEIIGKEKCKYTDRKVAVYRVKGV